MQKYWVYEAVEDVLGISAPAKLFKKDPENLGKLLRGLSAKRKDKICVFPEFIQKNNRFEFLTVYKNTANKKMVAERYASIKFADLKIAKSPAITLLHDLKECEDEQTRRLWLRIASPLVDSAVLLKTELKQPSWINQEYLEKNRKKIIQAAEEMNITYQVYSKYEDDKQLFCESTLKHAFPVILN